MARTEERLAAGEESDEEEAMDEEGERRGEKEGQGRSRRKLKLYCKGAETLVTPEFLEELGNGLLGSNESNNTVLHLVSKIGNMACVDYILGKHPSQIYSLNSNTETPAYVAAREGRADILGLMINFVRQKKENIESILTRRTDKHNALHIAIQNHHIEVVYLLIEEIPQLANHVNESNESALYLAAERGYFGIVRLILTKCSQIDLVVEGPNGKTALHAAAISDSAGCLKYLLNAKGHLLNVHDTRGWSPLHYAIHHNSSSAAKELLEANFSIGYQLLLEGGIHTPPIHIAASRGHCETLQVLMDMCPGCSEFVDNKGRNILHVAIENKKYKATEFIFRDESLTNLINQKDHKRDTPIHLLIDSDYDQLEMLIDSRVHINALDNGKLISSHHQKERLLKAITMNGIHDNKSAFSPKINESAQNEVECEVKEIPSGAKGRKADGRYMIVDNLVVVAALIATATFAAGFTVPGGFSSDEGPKQGTPLLLKKAAFKAFVVTNALAFSSSCSVLFLHISLLIYPNQFDEASPGQKEFISRKVMNMYVYTVVALIAMTIAFVTGVYVVLTPSHALAISVCVMSLALMEYIVQ